MNNKGFTLVEIIAVIAILGIIMSLSISSYVNYSDKLEEKNKENSISIIKMKAKDYYNSTGKNIFFVKELLTSEYLKPNQGNNYLINKEDYVCHIVSIETSIDENNKVNVTATIDETDYSLESSDEQGYINCDESKLEEKFSLSIKENTIIANIPKKSSVTIMTNLGDYTHQENNTDTNKQIALNIKNIENIPSTEDNNFLVVAQATLVDENNKITTKKISIKAKELKPN